MMYDKNDYMICSNCGNSIDVNHKFCTRCGMITAYNADVKLFDGNGFGNAVGD